MPKDLPPRLKNIKFVKRDPFEDFLSENKGLMDSLDEKGQEAFRRICGSVSTWRPKKARGFYRNMHHELLKVNGHGARSLILDIAVGLSSIHGALLEHYFTAIHSMPPDETLIRQWIALVEETFRVDRDVALVMMDKTPAAFGLFDKNDLMLWAEQALVGMEAGRCMYKAVCAYLNESLAWQKEGSVTLSFWAFPLEQAKRIAVLSPKSAEAFICNGIRVCLILGERQTERWIAEGLEGCTLLPYSENRNFRRKVTPDQTVCSNEEEMINYFSCISGRAIENRDTLISGVSLKKRSNTLGLICEALLGRRTKIASNQALFGVEGFTGIAATDGRTLYLPDTAPSFSLYKLMALHQTVLMDTGLGDGISLETPADRMGLHLETDRKLLQKLPGLLDEMRELAENRMPPGYPDTTAAAIALPLPWWGDILTGLVRETDETIERLKRKAAARSDLPEEVVDGVVTALMADGKREENALWELLREMFDNIEFQSPDAEELQESVKTFTYKEWDDNLADYKLDWCLVRQRLTKDEPNDFADDVKARLDGVIKLIRRQFTRLKPERFKKFRAQPYGDALDIDALVEAMVDKRSGAALSENIYVRRDKRIRDVAVLFLVDLSASTEEKVNSRRVIDIQKEAMVLMAEALDALDDPYAIYGFSSEGRFRVDLFSVKEFTESYDRSVQYRIGNLKPLNLTRMGTVIRHGIYKLARVPAAMKLMIILTDGRPYDVEYGGLDYAIADTKKALQEARRQNLHPFIITSDKKGEEYLRRISPQTGSLILPKVEMLPRLLPAIYRRLTM